MYIEKGEIKRGLKEFEPATVKRFERFLIDLGDGRDRTKQKYLYVLNKIPDELLEIKTKDDIAKLFDWMIDQDVETKKEIKAGGMKGAFQWMKNYNIVHYALKKWLLFKNQPELTLYLKKGKLKKTKRYILPEHVKIQNKNMSKIMDALDEYHEKKITIKIEELKKEAEKKKIELSDEKREE